MASRCRRGRRRIAAAARSQVRLLQVAQKDRHIHAELARERRRPAACLARGPPGGARCPRVSPSQVRRPPPPFPPHRVVDQGRKDLLVDQGRKFDPGFKMIPPKLERPAGRPRKKRIKASGEAGKRGPYQCKRCFQFGHIEKGCTATQAELEQELPPPRPKKAKKQRKSESEGVEASTIDAEPSQNVPDPKLTSSPGVTTRSMSSVSPTSPGPTTRRMASISPGGINRRLIIS